jgi:hypothetical protein
VTGEAPIEAPFFSLAARPQTMAVPDAGHHLNLQRDADVFFDRGLRRLRGSFLRFPLTGR